MARCEHWAADIEQFRCIRRNESCYQLTHSVSNRLICDHLIANLPKDQRGIAEQGRFCECVQMQKSGSGHCGWHHFDSDQGPEISQQAKPRRYPTTGNIAWICHYMQDANVEFRQNSKYRAAGRFGWKIRYDARQSLSAAVCRGPGDWRCIF